MISPVDLGAIGDGQSHPLSEQFATLEFAQLIYPRALSLSEEIDRHAIQSEIDEARVTGRAVNLPDGTFRLDWPIVLPEEVRVLRGTGATTLKVDGFLPGVVALPDQSATAPIGPEGLTYGQSGWVTFGDLACSINAAPVLTVDLTLTLPNPLPSGEWVLAASRGSLDNRHVETAFLLSVTGDRSVRFSVTTTAGSTIIASEPDSVPIGMFRLVAQYDGVHLRIWIVMQSVATLIAVGTHTGSIQQQPWEDVVMGYVPVRWPEGSGSDRPAPGTIYRAAQVKCFATWNESNPPTGPVTTDDGLGWFCDFSRHDGNLIPAVVTGNRRGVLLWRTGEYLGIRTTRIEGLQIEGGTHGIVLFNSNDGAVRDVRVVGHLCYGIFFQSQCYGNSISDCRVVGGRGGIILTNNSSIVTIRDCHVTACTFGIIMSDSAGALDGGWVDNCGIANLLVKGDNATISAHSIGLGHEGPSTATWNVLLFDALTFAFSGCQISSPGLTAPVVDLEHCHGGAFTGCLFGVSSTAPAIIRLIDHDENNPPVVMGMGRWPGCEAVPLFDSDAA